MKTLTRDELLVRLKKAIEPLVRELQPEFVLLFGSFAYGQPQKHSDVDLLIVLRKAPQPDSFSARFDLVQKHLSWSRELPSCELHIMTVDEFRRELLKRNVFVAEVVRKGTPLFSRRGWDEVLREVNELMEQGESLYPLDWLQWAEEDISAVQVSLNAGLVNVSAYHIQQAVEKLLKAFLLSQGWQLERTHDLPYLLQRAVEHEPDLQRFENLCRRASAFLLARYPRAVVPPPTIEEVQNWLTQVRELHDFVANALRQHLREREGGDNDCS